MADYKGYNTDWNSEKRRRKRQKAAQKRIKDDIRYNNSMISEEKRKAVGGYTVAPGGGTPHTAAKPNGKTDRGVMKKDFYVAENKEEAEKIKKQHPGAKVRLLQMRKKDGTYGKAFDMGQDPLPESSKGKAGTRPETYKDKEDVKLKKGDTILDKGERYVILKNTTYNEFMEMTEEYRKLYIAKKKGRKSGLEKGLGKQSGILTYDEKSKKKGYFMSGEQMSKEAVQYKKEKGKKGKVIRKDWIRKNPKTSEPPKQPENKPTQPTQEKGAFNSSDVKKNPKEYYEKNKDIINEMKTISPGLKDTDALKIIASGKFKNIQDFKEFVQKNKK